MTPGCLCIFLCGRYLAIARYMAVQKPIALTTAQDIAQTKTAGSLERAPSTTVRSPLGSWLASDFTGAEVGATRSVGDPRELQRGNGARQGTLCPRRPGGLAPRL